MSIAKRYTQNFRTLSRAFKAGATCLLECTDAKTGTPVVVLCAVEYDGKEYAMKPFAKMIDGNPYEQLIPPELPEEK